MNEWEKVAADADRDLPARIGWLNRLYEQGVIKRYLFLIETEDGVSLRYSDTEIIWAQGAAHRVQAILDQEWEEAEVVEEE